MSRRRRRRGGPDLLTVLVALDGGDVAVDDFSKWWFFFFFSFVSVCFFFPRFFFFYFSTLFLYFLFLCFLFLPNPSVSLLSVSVSLFFIFGLFCSFSSLLLSVWVSLSFVSLFCFPCFFFFPCSRPVEWGIYMIGEARASLPLSNHGDKVEWLGWPLCSRFSRRVWFPCPIFIMVASEGRELCQGRKREYGCCKGGEEKPSSLAFERQGRRRYTVSFKTTPFWFFF